MPPSPVDEHTEEFEQLAGLSALDVLEGDEHARFEQHAATCERCRLMVRVDRETLALAAPEMDPSPDFKARLMQRATRELGNEQAAVLEQPLSQATPEPSPQPLRRPPNVLPFWRRTPWASALAAVLVIGLVTAGGYAYENQVVASYALTGGVYSRSPANLERARREFRVGNLYLNRKTTGAVVGRQPFGGFKMSGIGSKAGGPDYLLQFVVPRTITENTLRRGFAPESSNR